MGGHLCSQMGQNGQARDKGGAKEEEKKVTDGLSAIRQMVSWPPFQGKGGLKDHFPGFQHTLSDFSTLLEHFWVILGSFGGYGPKSAKS